MSVWDDSWGYRNRPPDGHPTEGGSGRMNTSRGEVRCANTGVPSPLAHHTSLQPTGDGRMPTMVDAPPSAPPSRPTRDHSVTLPTGMAHISTCLDALVREWDGKR